jgi:hypothetical protein
MLSSGLKGCGIVRETAFAFFVVQQEGRVDQAAQLQGQKIDTILVASAFRACAKTSLEQNQLASHGRSGGTNATRGTQQRSARQGRPGRLRNFDGQNGGAAESGAIDVS